MKICWLIPDDRGGGVVSVALSCVRQARAAGHEATLLLLRPPTGWAQAQTDAPVESLQIDAATDRDASRAIVAWLEQHRPDVVALNGCGQADAAIPFLPGGMYYVYAVHDTAPVYWQTAIAAQADLDAIVAVSDTVMRKFADQVVDPGKPRVIHNGAVFPPPPETPASADDLIFLGGDNPTKGAHDVLRLWPRLIERGFAGHLHWFGTQAPAFRRRVEALPSAAGRIHCYGRAARRTVFDTAAKSKVLLMLSRVEPFGMVTIEAMSMGCVPVAWDIDTGTKEIVAPGTDFFSPLGDDAHLAGQIERALAGYDALAPVQTRRAREHFSEEIMWRDGYEPLLRELARRPAPARRSRSGQRAPDYAQRVGRLQRLPPWMRHAARKLLGYSPRLGYWLRDLRGW